MRIGIIGQPCIDEIIHLDDGTIDHPTRHALGGVLYSYCAMERLMQSGANGDRFVPLTWLAEPDKPMLDTILARLRNMDRHAGLWSTTVPTNRVYLVYDEQGERTAHCPNILPPLTNRELTPELLQGLDALFINMISGHDVSIDTLAFVLDVAERSGKRPYVHLDLHALVQADLSDERKEGDLVGYGEKPRGVREWKRWLGMADSIQVNEVEARWFGDPEVRSEEALLAYVREHRSELRLQSLIITRAERGASLYDPRRDQMHFVPIPEVEVVEPTGSGDVFGAAFTYALVGGCTPEAALRKAVEWATWNATLPGLEDMLTAPGPVPT